MSEFKREQRYAVFKLAYLNEHQKQLLKNFIYHANLPAKAGPDCVVVESDWPNYEETWHSIQAVAEDRYVSRDALSLQLSEARAEAATWEKRCVAETGALRDMMDQRVALDARLANLKQMAMTAADLLIATAKEGQDVAKKLEQVTAERDQLAYHLASVLRTYGDNSGFEPSLSVFQREIDRAKDYMASRQGGE